MLYTLFTYLVASSNRFSELRAFTYLSSRDILALLTSIILSMLIYPKVILLLRSLKAGQPIRELGFEEQHLKKGTPSMGGVVIIFTTLLSAFLWMDLQNQYLYMLTIIAVGFAGVGFYDDYAKIKQKNTKGLSGKKKLLGLFIVTLIAIAWNIYATYGTLSWNAISQWSQPVHIPFFKRAIIYLGVFYIPFILLVVVGAANAVNLTDGLDGLAIGPVITCAMTLLILSYVTGNAIVAKYLFYHTVHGSGEITVFLSALIGASIGFLWYNTFPAQIFMGDSGSLALGGILATVAIITGHEILLAIMGGIFVVETVSVILQVASFKLTGKRIFLMSPLHHHYQKKGWPEQKITVRIWIISFMLALLSILSLKLR